jgi:acetyl-CoA acetyltransferase
MLHARQSILAGDSECALVVGFEQGGASRAAAAPGRMPTRLGEAVLAELVAQSRRHAARNSDAVRRRALSSTQLLSVPTSRRDRLFTAPPSCGAAAAIVCSSRFGARLALRGDVAVVAQAAGCDLHGFDADHGGLGRTAGIAYRRAGIGPAEVHVVELHDACAAAKAHACAALGLCTIDALPEFVRGGGGTYGGKVVVGPSGGMLANGVAPNSGGLAQLVELTRQLRGEAGPRQVAGARVGLQHNVASSKEVVITVLQRV